MRKRPLVEEEEAESLGLVGTTTRTSTAFDTARTTTTTPTRKRSAAGGTFIFSRKGSSKLFHGVFFILLLAGICVLHLSCCVNVIYGNHYWDSANIDATGENEFPLLRLNFQHLDQEENQIGTQQNVRRQLSSSSHLPPPSPPRRRMMDEQDMHSVAGLDCQAHGGPMPNTAENDVNAATEEMVYWKDIPSDAQFTSPYATYGPTEKYLTFEPDEAGWNNQRMTAETMVVLALAMGRTLVVPPRFFVDYYDLFPLAAIAEESTGLSMISLQEFLEREGLAGKLINEQTGQAEFPPENNRTDWNGDKRYIWNGNPLWPYMRKVSYVSRWERDECVVTVASEPGPEGVKQLEEYGRQLLKDRMHELIRIESYTGRPTPVNATPQERLREVLAKRKGICIYNDEMQHSKVLHFIGDGNSGKGRVLAHFYAYVWFEDWHLDLWTKRFVRDHLRYADDIQCAAARIVQSMRQKAKENGNLNGEFDTFHIRRGDFLGFQPRIAVSAQQIYDTTRSVLLPENDPTTTEIRGTIYIATDEYERSFFDPLRQHQYDLYFLDDFKDLFPGLDATHWGMLEQLITSRGRNFMGTYFSTFTGYINRLRAYHAMGDTRRIKGESYGTGGAKDNTQRYAYEQEQGIIPSYYFAPRDQKYAMRQYRSISWPMWGREFPIAWRDIDHDIQE